MQRLMVLLVACISCQLITNRQMEVCFKASIEVCAKTIQSCLQVSECKAELQLHQSCQFQEEGENIFNGYCFKKWQQSAKLTSHIIQCFENQCFLASYNNQIGIKELQHCMMEVILDEEIMCENECEQQMEEVGKSIKKNKIKDIFQKQMKHVNASLIITKIKEECVQESQRKKIMQKQWAKKDNRYYITNEEQQL